MSKKLDESGILFMGKTVPAEGVRGQIIPNPHAGKGEPDFLFSPVKLPGNKNGNTNMPAFRSGHSMPRRSIGLHLSLDDRERIAVLDEPHTVTLSFERAGRDTRPFMDGKIVGWHAGSIDRGDEPGKTSSAKFLLNRLKDRKLAGRPPYTLSNVRSGEIKLDAPCNHSLWGCSYG